MKQIVRSLLSVVAMASGCTGPVPGYALPPGTGSGTPPGGCTAAPCSGSVGAVTFTGLSIDEAARTTRLLGKLPASLLGAPVAIGVDPVDQTGCPDPKTVDVNDGEARCGYSVLQSPDAVSWTLSLRSQLLDDNPDRLETVLTGGLATVWGYQHPELLWPEYETAWGYAFLASNRTSAWCLACPADPAEPCEAQRPIRSRFDVLFDFRSAVIADLLGDAAAWGIGNRWVDAQGATCTPTSRLAWLDAHLVQGLPSPYPAPQHTVRLDLSPQQCSGFHHVSVSVNAALAGSPSEELWGAFWTANTVFWSESPRVLRTDGVDAESYQGTDMQTVLLWSSADLSGATASCD